MTLKGAMEVYPKAEGIPSSNVQVPQKEHHVPADYPMELRRRISRVSNRVKACGSFGKAHEPSLWAVETDVDSVVSTPSNRTALVSTGGHYR